MYASKWEIFHVSAGSVYFPSHGELSDTELGAQTFGLLHFDPVVLAAVTFFPAFVQFFSFSRLCTSVEPILHLFQKVQNLFCTCFVLTPFCTSSALVQHQFPLTSSTDQNASFSSLMIHHDFLVMSLHQRSWGRDIYDRGVLIRTHLVNYRRKNIFKVILVKDYMSTFSNRILPSLQKQDKAEILVQL